MSFELTLPFFLFCPIEPWLFDESVSEIMGNPDASWSSECDGKLCQEPNISFDAGRPRTGREVIANQLGKGLTKTTLDCLRLFLREVLALRGYDHEAKRFLIDPIFEVKHATA